MGWREHAHPSLSSLSLSSFPFPIFFFPFLLHLTHIMSISEKQRGKQNLVRRAKNLSFKVMEQESPSAEKNGGVYVAYPVHLHFQYSIQCSVQISTTLHFKVNSPWKKFLPCRCNQKGQRNTTYHTHVLWNPYDYSSFLLTSQSAGVVTPTCSHNPCHWLCHCK